MTLKTYMIDAVQKLNKFSDTARLDVDLIVMAVLGIERHQVILRDQQVLRDVDLVALDDMVDRRMKAEPMAYILGVKPFMGLDFEVEPGVLIPRPDTEILVETILEDYKDVAFKGAEVGTGSGAICVSLLHYNPKCSFVGFEISEKAIEITGKNAYSKGVKSRLDLRYSDVFSARKADETFDVVVSNPPYIKKAVIDDLMRDVRAYEPHLALDGGVDGLDFYRKITQESTQLLNKGGHLYFEIGHDQGEQVTQLLQLHGFNDIRLIKDLAGHDRVVCGAWKV